MRISKSAFCRSFIISSNFKHSSKEIIESNVAGLLYESQNKQDFNEKFNFFANMNKNEKLKYKRNALIMSKNFTIFNHSKNLNKILMNKF